MKKIIILFVLLISQLSLGMSLEKIAKSSWWYLYDNQKWLLEDILECRDGNHESCNKMRIYLKKIAPIVCQAPYYHYAEDVAACRLIHAAALDQKFIEQLVYEHKATQPEAEKCACILEELSNH